MMKAIPENNTIGFPNASLRFTACRIHSSDNEHT